MTILTHDEILKAIKKDHIKIQPLHKENIGPGSVDLTLGNKFRVFKKHEQTFEVTEHTDYHAVTQLIKAETIIVRPGETILGITREKITTANNICGWLEGRSRFARLGLMIHISASFMQPGINNHQVLEITNMSSVPLRLHAGIKICQFIFDRTEGKAKYTGHFKDQTEP